VNKLKQQKEETEQRIVRAKAKSCIVEGQICGNCHLKIGHSQKKCDLSKCNSVFLCGQEKHHPGEVNCKKLAHMVEKEEKVLQELELEARRRETSIETVEKSVYRKIENELLEDRKEDYTNKNGHLDWKLLRKHTALIEKYSKYNLHGKIPSRESIPHVIKRMSEEADLANKDISRVKQSASKGNPFKKSLENYGITFPSTSADNTEMNAISNTDVCESKINYLGTPSSKEEEESQLQIAIRESLYAQKEHYEQPTETISSASNYFNINTYNNTNDRDESEIAANVLLSLSKGPYAKY